MLRMLGSPDLGVAAETHPGKGSEPLTLAAFVSRLLWVFRWWGFGMTPSTSMVSSLEFVFFGCLPEGGHLLRPRM